MDEHQYTGSKIKNQFTAYIFAQIRGARQNYIRKMLRVSGNEVLEADLSTEEAGIPLEEKLDMEYREEILMKEAYGGYPNWTEMKDRKLVDAIMLLSEEQVHGLTGKFVADLILQVLSYVAQIERDNNKQRQKEGIQIAKENGVKFGRPKIEIPEKFETVYWLWKENKINKTEAAKQLETNRTTFGRWIVRYEEGNEDIDDSKAG